MWAFRLDLLLNKSWQTAHLFSTKCFWQCTFCAWNAEKFLILWTDFTLLRFSAFLFLQVILQVVLVLENITTNFAPMLHLNAFLTSVTITFTNECITKITKSDLRNEVRVFRTNNSFVFNFNLRNEVRVDDLKLFTAIILNNIRTLPSSYIWRLPPLQTRYVLKLEGHLHWLLEPWPEEHKLQDDYQLHSRHRAYYLVFIYILSSREKEVKSFCFLTRWSVKSFAS